MILPSACANSLQRPVLVQVKAHSIFLSPNLRGMLHVRARLEERGCRSVWARQFGKPVTPQKPEFEAVGVRWRRHSPPRIRGNISLDSGQ